MTKPFFSDDLSDLIGSGTVAPRPLPQDEQLTKIREQGIGLEPTAPVFKITCTKCKGRGRFISYAGRDVGQCFACKGKGHMERKTAPAQLERAKERRLEVKAAVAAEAAPQIAWLKTKLAQHNLPETYSRMLGEFLARLEAGLTLSGDLDEQTGQLGVIAKGMARDAQYAADRQQKAAERVQAAPVVDATKIVAAIQKGKTSGLKWVSLRFAGVLVEEAKKHPGTLYVKAANRDRTYLGKVVDGRYVASRVETQGYDAHVFAFLQAVRVIEVVSDPFAAARVYGNVTGECCVCGKELTNKQSIEAGIGPICSGRMGWTPGGIRVPIAEVL